MPADLTYLGAFRLGRHQPLEAFGGEEGVASISWREDAGTLIVQSRGQVIGEFAPVAPVVSANADALPEAVPVAGYSNPVVGAPGNDRTGAVVWASPRAGQPARMYWSTYEYYNTDATDYPSLGWASISGQTMSASEGAWHVGPRGLPQWHGQRFGQYVIPIPQAWADVHTQGRSILVGRMREAGGAGGSMGPVLAAVGPWVDGPPAAGGDLSATLLMSYATADWNGDVGQSRAWESWRSLGDPAYEYWSPSDWHLGGAWVERNGKRALIMGGRKAEFDNDPPQPKYGDSGSHGAVGSNVPPYCYGTGGVECSGGLAISSSKGYHCGPYSPRLWFYDVSHLEEVAAGTRQPDQMQSYACLDPKRAGHWTNRRTANVSQYVAGPAYDPATGTLFVLDPQGDDPLGHPNPYWPIVHVYQVN